MDLGILFRASLPQRSPASGGGSSLPCGARAWGRFHGVCRQREISHNKKKGEAYEAWVARPFFPVNKEKTHLLQ